MPAPEQAHISKDKQTVTFSHCSSALISTCVRGSPVRLCVGAGGGDEGQRPGRAAAAGVRCAPLGKTVPGGAKPYQWTQPDGVQRRLAPSPQ